MALMQLRKRLVLFLSLCQLLPPFFPLLAQAEKITNRKNPQKSAPSTALTPGEEGLASYYAKRYNGRKTHSGERHDPNLLTAASPDLPLGCKVRVINLANGKEVLVTVNDRCRRKKIPFIDLSRSAADKLGFLGKGIAQVRIIPLDEELPEDLQLSDDIQNPDVPKSEANRHLAEQ